jgi:predicted RNA-binding Zn-ribbon protein involved in translation (DUF1610 family)
VKEKDRMAQTAYCVKCRRKVSISGAKEVKLKSGRKALKGKCPACGTTIYRFLKA